MAHSGRRPTLKQTYYRSFLLLIVIPLILVFACAEIVVSYIIRNSAIETIDAFQENIATTLSGDIRASALQLSHFVYDNNGAFLQAAARVAQSSGSGWYEADQAIQRAFRTAMVPSQDILAGAVYMKDEVAVPEEQVRDADWYRQALERPNRVVLGCYDTTRTRVGRTSQQKRQLRKNAAMPVTVVLSGYDEFDLVREAFRLGAYDYLLKADISSSGVAELLTGLREKVFQAAAGTRSADETPDLKPGDYVAALFTVEDFSGAAQRFGDNLRLQLEKPMLELARQLRRLQDRVFVRARTPSCYELYYRARDPMEAEETALSVVRQIQGLWHDFMNLDTAAGVSAVAPLEDVGQAMERCETLCRLASLRGPGGICEQRRYGLGLAWVFPERPDLPEVLEGFASRREREIWLRIALRRAHEVCGSQREKKRKNAIQLAKEFMQDNFTNPELVLKTVADYVGFSEKYFSTRFTRECGCTFINYLNDLRIKRAQDLLRQTDMKIYEVSDAVGYSSVEHFHHMFKKKLGISPKDFRTARK